MTVYTNGGAQASATYYAIKDHQNTVLALVDENGEVVESYDYDAWGRTRVFDANGDELSESAIGNRYCFQGREIDWATGLYYFRARWYNPVSGRWLSKDSIGITGGLNLYAFCGNNPGNFVDPTGESWISWLESPDPWALGFAILGCFFGIPGAIAGGALGTFISASDDIEIKNPSYDDDDDDDT